MLWDVFGNRRGSISVLSALAIFAVIGFSALALEFGHGLLRRVENQRIADISAYGGALVFNSTSSTTTAGFAAQNLASLNGLTSSAANPSVVNSPTGDGNQAVQVTVTTSDPLLLAAVLTTSPTLSVSATSYAELKANAPGCIIALSNSGTGVTVNGGATVSAPNCAVASNSTVTAHACSNTITTAASAEPDLCAPKVRGRNPADQQGHDNRSAGRKHRSNRRDQPHQHGLEHYLAKRPYGSQRGRGELYEDKRYGTAVRLFGRLQC